jgi:5,10-methylenetetrahydrofolate reductase
MDQAVAIATTLAGQLDIATEHIKQLKTELRESRALNEQLQQELQQQQPVVHITAKDIIEDMLADAAEKYAETGADDDYVVMMALQRKYDSM